MMTSSENNVMESTALLNQKTNEESTSFKKYLTPKYAIAATATIALGALGVASQSSSLGRGQLKLGSSNTTSNKVVVRQSRLGNGSPRTISLHTGCSPLNKLPFDTSSDWTGKIGAKVVSKSMQSDFRFENAQNLQETSCGNYEGTVDLEVGEEFGFYLYPLGDESDESTVLDNGCLHEGDGRCPAFSSPSALSGIEQCTSKYSDPGSGDVFYNRVFDGETLAYNWGTCETTCAAPHPKACPAPVKEDGPHQYWRYRLLEKEYAWNVKEIQFFPDTEFYDETQSTVAAPGKERGYGSGSKCIQSGQYGSHGCDRSFDDNLYSWWSNWASGDEAQSWIGIDLGSAKPVKHVRFMNGRKWPVGKEGVIEFSDDMNTWTEWSGDRITTEARGQKEDEGSKNNKWQEAAVVSAPAPAPPTEPEVLDAQTCPISSGTGDAGYADNYRGWYDASGCGICQDYCRWVGNSGSGGDPSVRTSSGDSFWSCRKAGGKASNPGTNQKDFCPDPSNNKIRNVGGCGNDNYSARGYYGDTFTHEKCSGQGVPAKK